MEYILLALVILGINVVPAFMPPTWIVLAIWYLTFHLLFLPTIIIGAVMATTGRVILALLSRAYGTKLLPKKLLKNYAALGNFFERHQKLTIPAVLMYAFFPISSNEVYIIAGLSKISLRTIAFSFLVGRLISYSFWVNLSYHLSKDIASVFLYHITNIRSISLDLLGLAVVILVGLIDWERTINKKFLKRK